MEQILYSTASKSWVGPRPGPAYTFVDMAHRQVEIPQHGQPSIVQHFLKSGKMSACALQVNAEAAVELAYSLSEHGLTPAALRSFAMSMARHQECQQVVHALALLRVLQSPLMPLHSRAAQARWIAGSRLTSRAWRMTLAPVPGM